MMPRRRHRFFEADFRLFAHAAALLFAFAPPISLFTPAARPPPRQRRLAAFATRFRRHYLRR